MKTKVGRGRPLYSEFANEIDRLVGNSESHIDNEDATLPGLVHENVKEQMKTKTARGPLYPELSNEIDSLIQNMEARVDDDDASDDANFPQLADENVTEQMKTDIKLAEGLKRCFGEYGIQAKARNTILRLLKDHGHPHLPATGFTLMGSMKSVKMFIQDVEGGEMFYSGLEKGLRETVTPEYLSKCKAIGLDMFWDGLSPYTSVKYKVWPLLCRLSATRYSKESAPFIVAIFGGKRDPLPRVFLKDFIKEAKCLEKDGLILNGVRYEVTFQKFIADYPARCRMKCVNGEGSQSRVQCERCTVIGKKRSVGGTSWTASDIRRSKPTLRTDKTFRERHQPAYHEHWQHGQREDSPFMQLSCDMVNSFCIDSMHVLYQGIMRRWWECMVHKKRQKRYRVRPSEEIKISDYMESHLKNSFPTEYARRVRGLLNYKLYKATEWRRFLLYDGILIAKEFLPDGAYRNFLLLSCAVRILSSPELINNDDLVSDAHSLLELFVRDAESKFGKEFMCMKAHTLTHLVKECQNHGTLDSFSAFPFESYLSRINRAMNAHGRCVQQIVGRIKEGHLLQPTPVKMIDHGRSHGGAVLSHYVGPAKWLGSEGAEYLEASLPGMVIRADRQRDSVFKTSNNEVLKVISIMHDTSEDEVYVIGCKFRRQSNFFRYPLKSSLIGIEKVWDLQSVKMKWRVQAIASKCVLLKINSESDEWLCLPLVHLESVSS